MATLTLTYEGKCKVTKIVTIPDAHEADYIDAYVGKLHLVPRPSEQTAVEKHLDDIIREIDLVFSGHINRKAVNAYIATLPTVRLK